MARRKPRLLKDLDINEVSNVDNPANQHSLHVLRKFNQQHDPHSGEFASGGGGGASAGAKQKADRLSDDADAASNNVEEHDHPSDSFYTTHKDAADAHREAATAQRSVGNDVEARRHDAMAAYHDAKQGVNAIRDDSSERAAKASSEANNASIEANNSPNSDPELHAHAAYKHMQAAIANSNINNKTRNFHLRQAQTHNEFAGLFNKSQPGPTDVHIDAALDSDDISEKPKCKNCNGAHATKDCPMKKSMADRAAGFIKSFFKGAPSEEVADDDPENFEEASSQLIAAIRKSATTVETDEDFLNDVGEHLAVFNAQIIEKVVSGLDNDVEPVMPDAGALSGEPVKTEKGMKTSEKEALLVDLRKKLTDAEAIVPEDAASHSADSVTKKDEKDPDKIKPVIKAEIQKLADENKSLRESVTKLQEAADERAALDEAKELVGKSGLDPKEVALLLRKGDDESRAVVKSMVAKAVVFAKNSKAFEEIGADVEDGGANVELEKMVVDVMKADPKLTKQQAITKVLSENPELYDETEYDEEGDE